MKPRTCILSAFALGTLFTSMPVLALAQNADDQALKAADGAFYAALSGRTEAAMDPLWAHAPYVAVIHPDSKAPINGWEAVRQSFVDIVKQTVALTVTPSQQASHRNGNTAWIVGTEAVRGKTTAGTEFQFTALVTNIYEFQDGHWLMVVHQASFVPKPQYGLRLT
jgi:ketosteroid isomerase-like protein